MRMLLKQLYSQVDQAGPNQGLLECAGFASGHICVWRADTGKHLRSMAGHTAAVMCLSLAQSGHMLLSGSDDKSIRCKNSHFRPGVYC